MKLYYFDQDAVKYLLSYAEKYARTNFESLLIGPENAAQIENSSENAILLSCTSVSEFPNLLEVLAFLKQTFGEVKLRIVVGGALCYILDHADLLATFPEISHVCVGKGEEFLVRFLDESLPGGIYQGVDFGKIRPYVVSKEYRLRNSVLITFKDNRCSWRRCRFCHHQAKYLRPVQSPGSVADDVAWYVDECGYKNFFFYDNEMDPELLREFLEILYDRGYAQKDVRFYVFGLRTDIDLTGLRPILDKWRPSPILGGAWGVEFYDQEVLDRYNKGILLSDVDRSLDFFAEYGIANEVYLLLGLPLTRKENIDNLERFIQSNSHKVAVYRVSFFLLNTSLPIYADLEGYKIRPRQPYTMRDFFYGSGKIPPVRTVFLDFDSWDEEAGAYVGRTETLKKYSSLFLNRKMRVHYNLCAVDLDTCRFLENLRNLGSLQAGAGEARES
ncbi:MAG: hypothetical protein ABIM40_05690 [Pseudomonadota bacterium]